MSGKDTAAAQRYNSVAMALHWLVAALVFVLIGLGWYMTDIPRGTPERTFFYNLHKSIGFTTAFIVLFRLWWRIKYPPPPLPDTVPAWQVKASRISHVLIYTCLIIMPVSGFSATQFTKWGLTYFELFKIPSMGPENKAIYDVLQGIHEITSVVLVTLLLIHIIAALKHLVVDRDQVFRRMLPGK
ncbi:MAG: cytochrome b [Burkholderiales bacterium]